ncbi:RsmB/NOP family class I SAM-dependent RNA methyltransferase [Schumannella sp. 10F1B-5-1]|uniref:RsmB/NOP family class I SAM-dependent RNA methyltransferase n=1 Tax=Schumannella sp. 10F1B-5-1 TaxID=2590780 RepID=UPI0011327A83|nr:transcription antitermination factor NusB [Schumannella sp. 10F1B-5-1]TPW71025.1 rRNA small subunit methyltransferase B [Schumannella sp. 10F1B-5-1]
MSGASGGRDGAGRGDAPRRPRRDDGGRPSDRRRDGRDAPRDDRDARDAREERRDRAERAERDRRRADRAANPPAPRPRVTVPRRVAFDVIRAVTADDAYANLLLPNRIVEAGLTGRDAGFATELAYGTLRRLGYYDRVIELAAGRETDRIDPPVLDVLRLGAHQLLGMGLAAHAAVDESVELTRAAGAKNASGFVNGVLRTISRDDAEAWMRRATAHVDGDARLAVEHAHPEWVVSALRDALAADGRDDELERLLDADNVPPRVNLVALPGLVEPADVAVDAGARDGASEGSADVEGVSPLGLVVTAGDPAAIPAVRSGRARVQDSGSQLAALVLSRARAVGPGERWLDLCAGPGGKAALLAAEAAAGGATLLANELVPARAGLVRRALGALPEPPTVVEGDGRRFGTGAVGTVTGPGQFDRILLDAPCTGLGALRRRPEARWRKQPGDVAELAGLQAELLDAAVAALKPGGLIAYVTCSPHLAETRDVVAGALARRPGLRALDTPAALAPIATRDLGLPAGTAAQLWPHAHGTDAMFIQLLTVDAE